MGCFTSKDDKPTKIGGETNSENHTAGRGDDTSEGVEIEELKVYFHNSKKNNYVRLFSL